MNVLKAILVFVASVSGRFVPEGHHHHRHPCYNHSDHECIHKFIEHHTRDGSHYHPSVPEVVRGDNFTEPNLRKYFDLGQVEFPPPPRRILSSLDAGQVIAIGKEAWTFIEENKPVVNSNVDYAGAVPDGVTDWRTLAGWKSTTRGPLVLSWINGFNSEVVHVGFKWTNSYNGNYLTQAGPAISVLDVSWGYTVDVSVKAYPPLNTGTVKNPMAQLDIELNCRISNVLKDTTKQYRARFKGDGTILYI